MLKFGQMSAGVPKSRRIKICCLSNFCRRKSRRSKKARLAACCLAILQQQPEHSGSVQVSTAKIFGHEPHSASQSAVFVMETLHSFFVTLYLVEQPSEDIYHVGRGIHLHCKWHHASQSGIHTVLQTLKLPGGS